MGFDLTNKMCDYYKENLIQLNKMLKETINFYFAQYNIEKFNLQKELEKSWNEKERDLHIKIKNGLNLDLLMKITKNIVEKICI